MNFFDDYPRFYRTTPTQAARVSKRYRAIIEPNQGILAGKKVLDIACYDGRWSFAAIKAGCASVLGIEGRQQAFDLANETFAHYKIEPSRFHFLRGDAVQYLRDNSPQVDVVMLLGFFYHINNHVEFAKRIAATGATHVILDTGINTSTEPVISLLEEPTARHANAIGEEPMALAGFPSRSAIMMIFNHAGFTLEREIDWAPIVREHGSDGVADYASGERATYVLKRPAR